MPQEPFYTKLSDRGLIFLSGPDRHEFLQNLVTNDLKKLETQQILYSCLLSPQGKFLHDFFIIEGVEDEILIDCEGSTRAQDLFKRLNQYKLRKSVDLKLEESRPVYAVFGKSLGWKDPRHSEMGERCFAQPEGLSELPFSAWDERRIRLCIPDGSRDMTPEQSTLDEAHIERLNGVSYDKGCYVGQELTARMHYRGLGKKHLYALEGDLPAPGEEIKIKGKMIGEMRSRCRTLGLALLKDDALTLIEETGVRVLAG